MDAAYAAYAVAAVVAAVALRMVLVAMYSAFWYVAAFSVLGFVAAAVVLGPLEALALAISVAKVTAKVAMGAWRGLRLFLRAGGVGPVVVALLAGAYSTRALFQHRRRPVETADRGTMTDALHRIGIGETLLPVTTFPSIDELVANGFSREEAEEGHELYRQNPALAMRIMNLAVLGLPLQT